MLNESVFWKTMKYLFIFVMIFLNTARKVEDLPTAGSSLALLDRELEFTLILLVILLKELPKLLKWIFSKVSDCSSSHLIHLTST